MADRRPKLPLDAIQAAELSIAFLEGQTLEAYSGNAMRRSAVERQLEVLGEAFVRLVREEPALYERLPTARFAVGCATASSTAMTPSTMASCTPPCRPICRPC